MKIGIVCYPVYGGSGVVATELGKALAAKGHRVHFISYRQPVRLDVLSQNISYHEVSMLDYPLFEYPPYELALVSKMVDVIRYECLDILHVHYAIPHAFAAWSAKQIMLKSGIDIPIVCTLHGTDITLVGKDRSFEPAVTFAINQSDAVTAVSHNLRDETYRLFDIQKEIHVIHNFVDFQRFSKQPKDHFKKAFAPNGEKVLMHTSNFRKVKRVEDVIRVFAKVHETLPSKLLMAGDGPERSKAENLVRELGIHDDVVFLGKIEAVEEVLSIADLFLLPSEKESFGLAALEAMACQVPVVSTDVQGIPEVNVHGDTGYLYKVGDIAGMTAGALDILSSPERHNEFRARAYTQAKRFDLEIILLQYEALYAELFVENDCRGV